MIGYFSGDFLDAQTHCERALEACTPGHEEKARERFGEYTGALVMSCLAITTWQLGKVDRARELIEMANRRAAGLGHAPSMGYPLLFRSHLEVLRGDAAAALSSAEALESCAREYGMTLWRWWAELISAWARGRLYDPAVAAAEFRRDLTACSDQGATINMAFFQALLAQLKTDTMAAETALKRIDDALALASQDGNRCYVSFIHRLRGEILLKRDPSNSAPPGGLPDRDRRRPATGRSQSRPASGACIRQTPPIDRPSGGSPPRPRAGARRLLADARDAGDR